MKRNFNTKHISIDGKCVKGAKRKTGLSTDPYIVSALDNENGISIIQDIVDSKSNEIPIVKDLLKQLDLKDKIITVDALNTQVENTKIIINEGGDYIFPLKENHGLLYSELVYFFNYDNMLKLIKDGKLSENYCKEVEIRSSKPYVRECFVHNLDISAICNQVEKDGWVGVKQVVMIKTPSSKHDKEFDYHYFISSKEHTAKEYLDFTKDH